MATAHETPDPQAVLRTVFGFDRFRPLQREIVETLLAGRDVFVLMPTGGGKSLCYQLPALLRDGLTVVVSPLIALMKDQVDALTALGVSAGFVNSSLDRAEIARRQAAVARGELKLLYVAPERLLLPGFLPLLQHRPPVLFAIDEAHCISEWGHDFRPEYRELRRLRELFPRVTLAAFTATATARVQADIVSQLGLERVACFRGSFNRSNLYYRVEPKRDAYGQLVHFIRQRPGRSGIVYTQRRADADQLARRLRADGCSAAAYHAGLEADERRERQEAFVRDEVEVMVATIAFGMGIDKPDVRFVVHYDLPKNLEGFYQESGRAGRDGDPADCLLLYSYADAIKQEHFIRQKQGQEREVATRQLRQMVSWAQTADCRRRALLAYFDEALAEPVEPCCDLCSERRARRNGLAPAETLPTEEPAGPPVDCTVAAQMLLSCTVRTGQRFGLGHLIEVLRGSRSERVVRLGHDQLSTYGIGKDRSRQEWDWLAEALLRQGYLQREVDRFNALTVTPRGRLVLQGQELVLVEAPASTRRRSAAHDAPAEPDGPLEAALFEQLRALRKRLADEAGVPPYVIFHDVTLRAMCQARPASIAALQALPRVGQVKAARYGDAFLEALRAYRAAERE